MKSVEDLDVFKLAHQLALKTYSTTKTFPSAETFSLVDQVQANCWDNDLNGAKRLNGWNDWNGCSFIHRVLIVRDGHEHDHEVRARLCLCTNHDHGSSPVTITSFLIHDHEPRTRGLWIRPSRTILSSRMGPNGKCAPSVHAQPIHRPHTKKRLKVKSRRRKRGEA